MLPKPETECIIVVPTESKSYFQQMKMPFVRSELKHNKVISLECKSKPLEPQMQSDASGLFPVQGKRGLAHAKRANDKFNVGR